MDEPMRPPQDEEPPSRPQIILGFVLTLVAAPILFVATCVPLGVAFGPLVPVYVVAFAGGAAWWAIRTKNKGIRWGLIAAVVVCAAAIAYLVWSLSQLGIPAQH
jgi:hypothetical protein